MKIGIITYHSSHNYGSMLQAYALSYVLKNKGCDVEIIDYRNNRQLRLYRHPLMPVFYKKRNYIKYFASFCNPVWLYHECRKWSLYEKFIKDYLNITDKRYNTWEGIEQDLTSLQYDVLIAGGDQIWNMKGLHFDKSYYLPCDSFRKKISYAVSFGGEFLNKIEPEERDFIKKHLSSFSAIAVREETMKDYLEQLLHKKVFLTIDPTLLLKPDDYQPLINKPLVTGDYIYYYSPFSRPQAERLAILYGNYLGLDVITTSPHIYKNKNMRVVHESGPKEFLNLLCNAKMVIGRSFHLIAFSLLFHRDFIVVDGAKDDRMRNILGKLGLLERGMVDCNNYREVQLSPIDYDKVDAIISKQRDSSIKYLEESLGI